MREAGGELQGKGLQLRIIEEFPLLLRNTIEVSEDLLCS